MMIAAMHTQGTWVLTQFGQEDKSKVDEKSDQELKDLAATLHLDVDDEILNDKGYAPLCFSSRSICALPLSPPVFCANSANVLFPDVFYKNVFLFYLLVRNFFPLRSTAHRC
eukprot:97723-Amorphochlora_amoeboformis.AAC.2